MEEAAFLIDVHSYLVERKIMTSRKIFSFPCRVCNRKRWPLRECEKTISIICPPWALDRDGTNHKAAKILARLPILFPLACCIHGNCLTLCAFQETLLFIADHIRSKGNDRFPELESVASSIECAAHRKGIWIKALRTQYLQVAKKG